MEITRRCQTQLDLIKNFTADEESPEKLVTVCANEHDPKAGNMFVDM